MTCFTKKGSTLTSTWTCERFIETRLPDKENFYSKLNDEHITDKGYVHAQAVREAFECKTLGDYHDPYVKTDIALPADVFENFQNKGNAGRNLHGKQEICKGKQPASTRIRPLQAKKIHRVS